MLVRSIALTTVLCSFFGVNHALAQPIINTHPVAATTCIGNTASFTVSATGAYNYEWQVNTGSGFTYISNGGVYSGAYTSTLTITGATAGMNGYTYRVIAYDLGMLDEVNSNAAALTVSSTNTWTGTTSNSWDVASNWSCGYIPTATSNVVIPSGTTLSPVVNSTTAVCNNLTINSGASMTFQTGSNVLEVKGTFVNNGTFTVNNGKLKLSGTTQAIPAATYKDLEISGGGTKTAAGAINVSGVLTLSSGYLQLGNNSLTLGNSASVVGGSPSSFVITNGSGPMRVQNLGATGKTGAVTFPIGTAVGFYTPVTITNTGTNDIFGARVINSVYSAYTNDVPSGAIQNTYNVNKTWLITEGTAGGSNANITFGWDSNAEQPGFNSGACFVGHYHVGRWNTAFPAKTANGFDPYEISVSGIKSFSPFAVGSQFSLLESGTPLPLDLLSFSGKNTSAGTKLSWITANEKDVAGFEVERADDGKNYRRIAEVSAKGTGTETEAAYNYTDNSKLSVSKVYYRLKMMDTDGTYKYSNVVVIKNNGELAPAISLYPNPASGEEVFVQLNGFKAGSVEIKIVTLGGQILHHSNIDVANGATLPVNIKQLPAGVYYFQANDGEQIESLRFTKL